MDNDPTKVAPWTDLEIRFYAADDNTPLTRRGWNSLEAQLKNAHAIWAKVFLHTSKDRNSIRILNPKWDHDLRCGVIPLPEGANARTIRDGFIPTLYLPTQLKALIKGDLMAPVVRTRMEDHLYEGFTPEAHVDYMKLYNPILEDNKFEVLHCQIMKEERILYIKTNDTVLEYLRENKFTIPYPSGEITFSTDVTREVESSVCTLPQDQKEIQFPLRQSLPTVDERVEDAAYPPDLLSRQLADPIGVDANRHNEGTLLSPFSPTNPANLSPPLDPMVNIYDDVSLATADESYLDLPVQMAIINSLGVSDPPPSGNLELLADVAQLNAALGGERNRLEAAQNQDDILDLGDDSDVPLRFD